MTELPKVDLAHAYERDGTIRLNVISGRDQHTYVLPDKAAITLLRTLAVALTDALTPYTSGRKY